MIASQRGERVRIHAIANLANERQVWSPVLDAAEECGLQVSMSEDAHVEAEIGLYCTDRPRPGNQYFTVVTMNGLDQDHRFRNGGNEWRFFLKHGWRRFDLGLLPGVRWASNAPVRFGPRLVPRMGLAIVGWPKSDHAYKRALAYPSSVARPVRTVLYAPQSGLQERFCEVRDALDYYRRQSGHDVKLRVKFWEDASEYAEHLQKKPLSPKQIEDQLYAACLWRDDHVFDDWIDVLDPHENIMNCFDGVDLLVTDQSSVLYEALVFAIPAIVVSSHLKRLPSPQAHAIVSIDSLSAELDRTFEGLEKAQNAAAIRRDAEFSYLGHSSQVALGTILTAYAQKINQSRSFFASLPTVSWFVAPLFPTPTATRRKVAFVAFQQVLREELRPKLFLRANLSQRRHMS